MATVAPGNQDDLVGVIVADHRTVELIFAELATAGGTPRHRRELADHLTTELVRHSVAEEMYMYPAARKVLPDGDRVADHEIEEHAEVERLLKDLEGVDATDRLFDDLIGRLSTEVRHHIGEEESDLLPRLQQACDPDELLELGRMVARAKASAPTRPHPSAPTKPPLNLILAPGTGMIDKLRDALTGRNRD
ncbi:hemerythrin domain-containing protein [Kribbella sp.]|uniref:hemerythrin domain-containing protein n=1 Tax=Kribbella sp. TaxID=1871183 RepID=UPI002D436D05|nr:hemerythrin domain-containing protein [Kribbella sp.]HZX05771.1 hemerythrin domain-containing protein [Kribbella sp.]